MRIKKISLTCIPLAMLGFLLGCPSGSPSPDDEQVVPVYRLSDLPQTSACVKSVSVTVDNYDLATVPLLSTMFQGFATADLTGSTYQTTVVDHAFTFDVIETDSGTRFESTTTEDNVNGLPMTLSVTVNPDDRSFSIAEESILDYDLPEMGSGVIYRNVATPEYDGIESFHIDIELKYYDYTGPTYAKIDASWIELFKDDQIFGLLIKSENIDDTVEPVDPHQWDQAQLEQFQTAMAGVDVKSDPLSDTGRKYWTGSPTDYSCILVVYNLESRSFEYMMSDASGYFCGPIDVGGTNKPTIAPTNGFDDYQNRYFEGTQETLSDVLAKYGWTLLP